MYNIFKHFLSGIHVNDVDMTFQKCVGVHALMHHCVETHSAAGTIPRNLSTSFIFQRLIFIFLIVCVSMGICACESVSTSQSTKKDITALELELHDILRHLT